MTSEPRGCSAIGLPVDAERLSKKVSKRDFPRIATALARTAIAHDADEIKG
jgi:hypothetical protein